MIRPNDRYRHLLLLKRLMHLLLLDPALLTKKTHLVQVVLANDALTNILLQRITSKLTLLNLTFIRELSPHAIVILWYLWIGCSLLLLHLLSEELFEVLDPIEFVHFASIVLLPTKWGRMLQLGVAVVAIKVWHI